MRLWAGSVVALCTLVVGLLAMGHDARQPLASAPSGGDSSLYPTSLSFGNVTFHSSCGCAASASCLQSPFEAQVNSALAALHSFWYPEARARFEHLTELAPDCTIAWWGKAMTFYTPLWSPPGARDTEEALQALAEGEKTFKLPNVRAVERRLVETLATFFRDKANLAKRVQNYATNMAQLWHEFSQEKEVMAFYGLSLLANAEVMIEEHYAGLSRSPSHSSVIVVKDRDAATNAIQNLPWFKALKRAGKLCELLLSDNAAHPGGLHYLLHSYDLPQLASLALPYAEVYSVIAPRVPHALHMPAHIYLRLGMWDKAIQQDTKAMIVSEDFMNVYYSEAKHLSRPMYDEYLHSCDYAIYAHLQQAQDRKAFALAQQVATMTDLLPGLTMGSIYSIIASTSRFLLETHRWEEGANYRLTPLLSGALLSSDGTPLEPPPFGYWPFIMVHYIRLVSLAHLPQPPLDKMRVEYETMLRYYAEREFVWTGEDTAELGVLWVDVAKAYILEAEGHINEAIKILAEAADTEDAFPKPSVKPSVVYPAREQLADMLLKYKRCEAARNNYKLLLELQPNRYNAIFGMAQAAEQCNEPQTAVRHFTTFTTQVRGCDLDAIHELRSGYVEDSYLFCRDGSKDSRPHHLQQALDFLHKELLTSHARRLHVEGFVVLQMWALLGILILAALMGSFAPSPVAVLRKKQQ
ncbi:Tetratricopeptide repeat protein [Balamuthia mandrillaris]